MKMITVLTIGLTTTLVMLGSVGNANATCQSVHGHFRTMPVPYDPFDPSMACPTLAVVSPGVFAPDVLDVLSGFPGFCAQGEAIGGIHGTYRIVLEEVVLNRDVENVLISWLTSKVEIETKDGTLFARDASSSSDPIVPSPGLQSGEAIFGGILTITGGTGKYTSATGWLHAGGIFRGGSVPQDNAYSGLLCVDDD